MQTTPPPHPCNHNAFFCQKMPDKMPKIPLFTEVLNNYEYTKPIRHFFHISPIKLSKNSILKKVFFCVAVFLIFISQYATQRLSEYSYLQYASIFIIGLICSAGILFSHRKNRLLFNWVDFSLIFFVFILLARFLFTNNHYLYSKALIGIALLPIYFFIKCTHFKKTLHLAIISAAILQLLFVLLQKLGCQENINPYFTFGGTFGNPNVLSMVLLMSLFSAIYLIDTNKNRPIPLLLLAYIIVSCIVIFSTKCRSAILGMMVVFVIWLIDSKPWKKSLKKRLFTIGFLATQLGVFIFLIIIKFDSLAGRILIWKASWLRILEKPIWGHGISSFHRVFPSAQKELLVQNNNHIFHKVAGAPKWVHNDYLEMFLEGGIFLLLAFVTIFAIAILIARKTTINKYSLYAVIAFYTMAIVNFVYTAWPVLLIFIFNLAVFSSSYTRNTIKLKPKLKNIIFLFSAIFLTVMSVKTIATLSFLLELQHVEKLNLQEHTEFFEDNKQYLYYPLFNSKYAKHLKHLEKYDEAIEVMKASQVYANTFNSNLQLANTYMEINALDSAAKYFMEAMAIIPSRSDPKRNLKLIENELGIKIINESVEMK